MRKTEAFVIFPYYTTIHIIEVVKSRHCHKLQNINPYHIRLNNCFQDPEEEGYWKYCLKRRKFYNFPGLQQYFQAVY